MIPEVAPFNNLTPAEAERLALLLEELGEAQQAIGKILRHGYESTHPNKPNGPTNRDVLTKELGDVAAAINLLCWNVDLSRQGIDFARQDKIRSVKRYLHHQDRIPGVFDEC